MERAAALPATEGTFKRLLHKENELSYVNFPNRDQVIANIKQNIRMETSIKRLKLTIRSYQIRSGWS